MEKRFESTVTRFALTDTNTAAGFSVSRSSSLPSSVEMHKEPAAVPSPPPEQIPRMKNLAPEGLPNRGR